MITEVFQTQLGVDLGEFPIMTYQEAAHRFGSDKPDLRVKLEFTELTDVMKDVDFKVFSGAANMKGGRVVALRVPGGSAENGGISRGEIDAYTEFVKIYGAKGLAYIRVNELAKGRDGLQSPIVKNIHDAALAEVLKRSGAQDGDLLFFGADKEKIVNDAIGALRIKIGHSEFGKKNGLFETVGLPCGWWTSPCSSTTRKKTAGRLCTIPSPAPRMVTKTSWTPILASALPRPTTWCSTAGSWAAVRCVSTVLMCKARCSQHSRSRLKTRRPSSATCSTPCSTARLRTVVWPLVWTASSR